MKMTQMVLTLAAVACSVLATVAAHAQAEAEIVCTSPNLEISLSLDGAGKAKSMSVMKATDEVVRKNLQESAGKEIFGPAATTDASFPVGYEGQFSSPVAQVLPVWDLYLNLSAGKGQLEYDNDDGDMRTFNLDCRTR